MKFAGVGIAEIARLSVSDVHKWVEGLQKASRLTQRETDIARDLIPEIKSRLLFLEEVGLGYLTLDRGAPTLSGGEAQRIRLAAQLGSNLQGVCYVLDEPTIGLHARDNKILLGALQSLSDKGNTLVVVEHDEDTIRHADHIIDIGPSAGKRGGRLVAEGSVKDVQRAPDSQTGRYLLHAMKHPVQARRQVTWPLPAKAVELMSASVAELGSDSNSGRALSGALPTNTKLDSDPNSAEPKKKPAKRTSRAKVDLPEPLTPVMATRRRRGTWAVTDCRLCRVAEWTVSQDGVGTSDVEVAWMAARAIFKLLCLLLAGFFFGSAELGSESNFVLVGSAPESMRDRKSVV